MEKHETKSLKTHFRKFKGAATLPNFSLKSRASISLHDRFLATPNLDFGDSKREIPSQEWTSPKNFIILDLRNPGIDELYVVQKRQSTDSVVPKL